MKKFLNFISSPSLGEVVEMHAKQTDRVYQKRKELEQEIINDPSLSERDKKMLLYKKRINEIT